MEKLSKIQVKCHSGYIYAERPESFVWLGQEHKVALVESAWLEPGKRFFRIVTADEKVCRLCYNEAQDEWWLITDSVTTGEEAV